MLQAATLGLTVPIGGTFYKQVVLPIDCTDREVAAQIWKIRGSSTRSSFQPFTVFSKGEQVCSFVIEWIDRAFVESGITKAKFALKISAAVTAQLSSQYEMGWDLLVIDGTTLHSGDRNYWLQGIVTAEPTLTEVS